MTWRPPTIAKCLLIASKMGSVPVEKLLDRPILAGLDLAVDGPRPDHTLEPAEQAAVRAGNMIDRLLSIAELPEPARTSERIARLTFEQSGIVWRTDPVGAAILIRSYSRSQAGPMKLADHFLRSIDVPPQPEPPNWPEIFSAHHDEPFETPWVLGHQADARFPTVYLSNALTHLLKNSEPHLEGLRYAVARGLDAALSHLTRACPIRLVQPSALMAEAAAEGISPADCRMFLDWLVTEADALIISDVGGRAPGFGAGVEASVFLSQHGPTLEVREKDCGVHSTLQDVLVPMLGAQVESAVTLDDGVATCCAIWFTEVYEEILAAHRRRENERVLNLGLHHTIVSRVAEASPDLLDHALCRSRLSPGKIARILDNVDQLGDVARHQVEGLLRVLTARSRVPVLREPAKIDIPALIKAGEIKGWSQPHMRRLLDAAQTELRLTGAMHRLTLMEPEDWIMFDERLRG
jgi:hypothetical protein